MNKEKTLAAHRIKKKLAEANKAVNTAKSKTAIAESKTKKILEAFDAAKKVVNQQKDTLELAKKQILENRKLIKNYEKLLGVKYMQHENAVKLQQKAEALNAKHKKSNENLRKKLEAYTKRCSILEARVKKMREEKELKSKVVSQDLQVVKRTDSKKAKVEAIKRAIAKKLAEKAGFNKKELSRKKAKIAKVYSNKFGIAESFANNILDKHGMTEGLVRLQKLAEKAGFNKKELSRKKAKIAKVYSNKFGIAESFANNILDKHGMTEGLVRLQKIANRKVESKKISMVQKIRESKNVSKNKKAKAKATNEEINKIVKIYTTKYKMPEAACRKIFEKYEKNEAVVKLQSVANEISKFSESKKPETKSTNESKQKVYEASNVDSGVSLYSLFS